MVSIPKPWKEPYPDERGVSPVIGVILMVAITVILAATIGTLVFGLAPGGEPAPQVTWSYEKSGQNVTVVHEGGDPVNASDIQIKGATVNGNLTGTYTGGDTFSVNVSGSDAFRIVFTKGDGETAIIGEWNRVAS